LVSRYQKSKTSLDLNEARDDGFWDGSGFSWTICKLCTSLQTDNHTNISSLNFSGRMLFLTTNQQCRSTEGTVLKVKSYNYLIVQQRLAATTHTHTRLTALCPGLPRCAATRKVKSIWIFLKQEIVSGSGISWALCKSAARSRQLTMPSPHHSVFYRLDALPTAQPTA